MKVTLKKKIARWLDVLSFWSNDRERKSIVYLRRIERILIGKFEKKLKVFSFVQRSGGTLNIDSNSEKRKKKSTFDENSNSMRFYLRISLKSSTTRLKEKKNGKMKRKTEEKMFWRRTFRASDFRSTISILWSNVSERDRTKEERRNSTLKRTIKNNEENFDTDRHRFSFNEKSFSSEKNHLKKVEENFLFDFIEFRLNERFHCANRCHRDIFLWRKNKTKFTKKKTEEEETLRCFEIEFAFVEMKINFESTSFANADLIARPSAEWSEIRLETNRKRKGKFDDRTRFFFDEFYFVKDVRRGRPWRFCDRFDAPLETSSCLRFPLSDSTFRLKSCRHLLTFFSTFKSLRTLIKVKRKQTLDHLIKPTSTNFLLRLIGMRNSKQRSIHLTIGQN